MYLQIVIYIYMYIYTIYVLIYVYILSYIDMYRFIICKWIRINMMDTYIYIIIYISLCIYIYISLCISLYIYISLIIYISLDTYIYIYHIDFASKLYGALKKKIWTSCKNSGHGETFPECTSVSTSSNIWHKKSALMNQT